MTPVPAKVPTVAKQSSQYRVLVQIELVKMLRFLPHLEIWSGRSIIVLFDFYGFFRQIYPYYPYVELGLR